MGRSYERYMEMYQATRLKFSKDKPRLDILEILELFLVFIPRKDLLDMQDFVEGWAVSAGMHGLHNGGW